MTGLLEGKVSVVTGGTSGIGARTAELFVSEGRVSSSPDDATTRESRSPRRLERRPASFAPTSRSRRTSEP
jgi:NAD(P)-dependent dehydrogenase (short-subunit alcohol dehydrogenase family)